MNLSQTRIRGGSWEGLLTGSEERPELTVTLLDAPLPGVEVAPLPDRPGAWAVRVPIPAEALNEGVQTFLIRERTSGEKLAHFTIITGVPVEDDLRAEVDLLRAELDMLKRAFRRHCTETTG
ncbi:hypothetical protein [Rhodobacter sp. CZR27]|uniref:hypothetical protein n=1 Tax=Rhodobacter sp. CZR27 TaxID=2033869 RepID=UPI000BBF38F3|nr:hypothetical protein [Rhodobacter sp. CZR27]